MTVLTPANAFPNLAFPQHGSGQTQVKSFTYPGAVWPKATGPAVLSSIPVISTFTGPISGSLSGGNLTLTQGVARSAAKQLGGKLYCEFTVVVHTVAMAFGITATTTATGTSLGNLPTDLAVVDNGNIQQNGVNTGFAIPVGISAGDNIGMAVDFGNAAIWFRQNGGNWNNSGVANPATNVGGAPFGTLSNSVLIQAAAQDIGASNVITANFGASSYVYTPPAGFGNWLAVNAFPSLPFPQHLSGQTNTVQDFLYPGAVQPQFIPPGPPPSAAILWAQSCL